MDIFEIVIRFINTWYVLILEGGAAVLFFLAISYYTRPRISYFESEFAENSREGSQTWQFLFRNFDPITQEDLFVIDVEANGGIEKITVAAGPWFQKMEPSPPVVGQPVEKVSIHFGGVPAEGVFAVHVTTKGSRPQVSVSESSKIHPRVFRPARSWPKARLVPVTVKTLLGFAVAVTAYKFGEAAVQHFVNTYLESGPLDTRALELLDDIGVIGWLLVISIFSYLLNAPFSGKESILGSLGNRDATDGLAAEWSSPSKS